MISESRRGADWTRACCQRLRLWWAVTLTVDMLPQRRRDERFRVRLLAGELDDAAAFANDHHTVAEMRRLLGLARVEEERLALLEQPDHQLVDVVLRGDVDAAGDVVEQHHVAAREQPPPDQHLLLIAARERPDLLRARPAGPDLEALDDPRDEPRLQPAA